MRAALTRCPAASVDRLLCLVQPERTVQLLACLRSAQQDSVRSSIETPSQPRSRSPIEARPRTRALSPIDTPRLTRARRKPDSADHLRGPFVAIDFETADTGRDSACAIAAVRVEGDEVVDRCMRLIRPPRQAFQFTYIHGIRWTDVAREPTFGPVWNDVRSMLKGAAFLVAHNASFDKSVLNACCSRAGLEAPCLPFECTVRWARQVWGLRPTNLPAVCRHLDLPLRHHDAASDAEACARIMIAARREHAG
ncbi:MAG: 3'-5' exonuclease [Deltaproteobacteria bacterium]|nr:3'-5' exonuclease [Deltaproteobacteria bacterium]